MNDLLEKPVVGKRYRLEAELGRGAMGGVYRALDRLTGEVVALKRVVTVPELLHRDPSGEGTDLRMALSREFQSLSAMHHPYVIGVRDYGFDEQHEPFFTMEYLPDPRTILEAGAGQPDEVKVTLLVQLLQALVYIHQQGIVHRDLKPSNVLVSGGQVKVLDFGLAVFNGGCRGISGSLAYLAPELLAGAPATPVSDLYAVGVLAYELFAGRHPFETTELSALLDAILEEAPDCRRPGIPAAFTAVLERLLAKDPALRYPEARAVIRALGEGVGTALVEETEKIRESFLQAATFVGREAELEKLTDALERARNGSGSAWLVGGECGVGKSRLLRELRAGALVRGVLVMEGRAVLQGGLPYQVWRDPARWLVMLADPDDLEAGVLRLLLPDIEGILQRPVPEAPELEPQAAQVRLLSVMAALLRRCTEGFPVMILLEDLQWMGDDSRALLYWMNRLVSELPVLLVGSYRDDEAPELPEQLPGMHPLRLGRLARESVAALSAAMLGEGGRRPELVAFLQRETEGNAFFLVEVVRTLAEEAGRLDRVGAGRLPKRILAGGVAAVVQRRLSRVPTWAEGLLRLAAVAGRQLDLQVLRRLATGSDLERWLRACANAVVLERQETQWQFAHDKLREGLLDRLETAERRILHRRVGEALEQVHSTEPAGYAAELAYHFREAAEPERERRYALLAGLQAAAQYANERALQFLERAWELTPEADREDRYTILLAQVKIHDLLGEREAQIRELEALQALAEALDDDVRRIEGLVQLTEYTEKISRYPEAVAVADQAIALLQRCEGGAELGAQVWVAKGHGLHRQGNYEAAERCFEQALALAQGTGLRQLEGAVLRGLGMISRLQGRPGDARRYGELALQCCQAIGDRKGMGSSLNNLGVVARELGEMGQSLRYFKESWELFREIGDRHAEGTILTNQVSTLAYLGRYEEAQEYGLRAREVRRAVGDRRGEAMVVANLARMFHHWGRYEAALNYAREGLEIGREIGGRGVQAWSLTYGAYALEALARWDEAEAGYRQALEIRRELGETTLAMEPLAGLARLALGRGDPEQAGRYVDEILEYLQTHTLEGADDSFWVESTCYQVLRAQGDLERGRERLDAAYRDLQAQAARIEDDGLRRSLLEDNPINRALVVAWQQEYQPVG